MENSDKNLLGLFGGDVSIYTACKFPGQKDFTVAKNFHVFSTQRLLKPEYMAMAGKSLETW